MASSFVSVFAFCFLLIALADEVIDGQNGVTFLYPTQGVQARYRDAIKVTYTSNFTAPLLFTFCNNATSGSTIQEYITNVTPYNGSELVVMEWKGVSICGFDLRPNRTVGYGANSPTFTVLPSARAVLTTLSLPTSTTTSGSTKTPTAAPGNTNTTMPTLSPVAGGGLSTGAKAGLGVGTAVGVCLIIAAVLAFFIFCRRRQSTQHHPISSISSEGASGYYAQQKHGIGTSDQGDNMSLQPLTYKDQKDIHKPAEIGSAVEVAHEMPTGEEGERYELSHENMVCPTTAARTMRVQEGIEPDPKSLKRLSWVASPR